MSTPDPDEQQPGESNEAWTARILAKYGSSSSSSSTSATKTKYTESELRLRWRAGVISEAEWRQALIDSGKSGAAADAAIAADKNTGVSTAAKTKGQLTAGEAADVEATRQLALKDEQARRATIPQNGERDSYENPARAGIGLSSVTDKNDSTFLKNNPGLAAGGKVSTSGSSGSGTGSTAKLPLTPEEEFLKKQADKVAAQQLAQRMQRQAEDQYILDSGGQVQRNPQTGGLESMHSDSSGKYQAIVPHEYDAATGQITPGQAAGWQHTASQEAAQRAAGGQGYGNSLNPEGAWWQNADAQTIEDNRRLNAVQLSQKLGRPLTPADLLSPPGGTFALGGGDPVYQRNLATLKATGKIMPTMTNGPSDGSANAPTVAGSTGQVVNPFGPAGAQRVTPTYGQSAPPPVMTQQEMHNYNVTGSINPGAAELGGRTMGELENQQTYGADAAPDAAKAAVMANLASGKIFDFDQLMKQHGVKQQAAGAVDTAGIKKSKDPVLPIDPDQPTGWLQGNPQPDPFRFEGLPDLTSIFNWRHGAGTWGTRPFYPFNPDIKMQAAGDVDMAGVLPQMATADDNWLTRNNDTSAILANRGVRAGEGAYGWNSDDGVNYGWQQNDYAHRLQQGTTQMRTQPDWHNWASTPGNNFAPGMAGEDYSRAWNGLITSAGKRPASLNQFNQTYSGDYPAYADGGTSLAGNPFSFAMMYPDIAAGIPAWMHGNLASNYFAQKQANGPGGWINTGATPTNTPTSWAPNPVMAASGGAVSTNGPTGLVDLQTGQMKGVYGEAGPEAAVMVPLSRPAKPGLPAMVQSMMMGGQGAQTANPNTATTQMGAPQTGTAMMPPGPTPLEMIRQQAKLMRPRVAISVGG